MVCLNSSPLKRQKTNETGLGVWDCRFGFDNAYYWLFKVLLRFAPQTFLKEKKKKNRKKKEKEKAFSEGGGEKNSKGNGIKEGFVRRLCVYAVVF